MTMLTYSQSTSFQGGHDSSASVSNFLSNKAGCENIQSQSSDVLWNVSVGKAETPRLLDDLPRIFTGLIMLGCYWNNFLTSKLSSQLLHLLLLIGNPEPWSLGRITSLRDMFGLQSLIHCLKSNKTTWVSTFSQNQTQLIALKTIFIWPIFFLD